MKKKPTDCSPAEVEATLKNCPPRGGKHKATKDASLLTLLEATAYDLWMSALTSTSPRGMELYQRMKSPMIGDYVMEITTYRRITKNRRGFGKLIDKTGNNHELETRWTIEMTDGKTCDWQNAMMIAIPAGLFDWFPSISKP